MKFFWVIILLFLPACAGLGLEESKTPQAPLVLRPVSFSDLPEWDKDNFQGLAPAFSKSCTRILKSSPDKDFGAFPEGGTYKSWQAICTNFQSLNEAQRNTPQGLRAFFERNFTPYEMRAGEDATGLFTGYYEASLKGSRTKTAHYNIPLYSRPDDLVMVDLGQFRPELKGQRIAGRVVEGNLKPYESRAQIVSGAWPHNDKVLVWVDNAVDAFFVQIQGSGIVELEGGETLRIGYAGQNGHIYTAIGRELVKRGALRKEDVSMRSIQDWLEAHPAQADAVMNTNESYVFFKTLEGADDSEGPLGAENVALTPARSLAVDRSLLAYGLPIWLALDDAPHIKRLMMAQDTGGAIRGPVRGDVFWGHGEKAEALAGPMKAKGRIWVLLPQQ